MLNKDTNFVALITYSDKEPDWLVLPNEIGRVLEAKKWISNWIKGNSDLYELDRIELDRDLVDSYQLVTVEDQIARLETVSRSFLDSVVGIQLIKTYGIYAVDPTKLRDYFIKDKSDEFEEIWRKVEEKTARDSYEELKKRFERSEEPPEQKLSTVEWKPSIHGGILLRITSDQGDVNLYNLQLLKETERSEESDSEWAVKKANGDEASKILLALLETGGSWWSWETLFRQAFDLDNPPGPERRGDLVKIFGDIFNSIPDCPFTASTTGISLGPRWTLTSF